MKMFMLAALAAKIAAVPMIFTIEDSTMQVRMDYLSSGLTDHMPEEMRGAFRSK